MRTSISFYDRILGFVLTIYISSTIIFFQNYILVTYLLGALFFGYFFFLTFLKKNPKIKTNSVIKLYGALTFVAIASSFWAVSFDLASIKSFQMVYILTNMFVLYNAIKIYHLEKYFLYGIFVGALANYMLLLGAFSPPFEIYVGWRAVGSMGNANVLALLMNFSIVSSILYYYLYKPNRYFLLYLIVNVFLGSYIILLTASKKGTFLVILLIVMFVLMNIKSIKKMLIIFILVLLALVFIKITADQSEIFVQIDMLTKRLDEFLYEIKSDSQFGSTAKRVYYINLGLNIFANGSIFGFGINNYREFTDAYSHNNYIEILVGLGLVGFTLLMMMYISILYKIKKIENNYIKYSLFAIMFGLMLMDIAMVSYSLKFVLFFIVFLSVIAENNQKKSSQLN